MVTFPISHVVVRYSFIFLSPCHKNQAFKNVTTLLCLRRIFNAIIETFRSISSGPWGRCRFQRQFYIVPVNPLVQLSLKDVCPEFLEVIEHRKLNPAKACGPDTFPNWLLKEYTDFLEYPITTILTPLLRSQRLPSVWKLADVTPIPKKKPVKDLMK